MQDTSQRTSSSSARLGVPSHIPPDQRSPISSHLEEGTDRSVIALQGPQLLPGGFLQLGIEAPGGAALHGEEERNLLEKKGAGLGGKEPHSTDGAASSLAACSRSTGRSHPSPPATRGMAGLAQPRCLASYVQPLEIWVMPKAASYLGGSSPRQPAAPRRCPASLLLPR